MIPSYYFIDPSLFSTVNVDMFTTENAIGKLASFYISIKEIEDILLSDGDIKTIFCIPIRKDIMEDCLSEAPSCDQGLSNAFWKTFLIIYNKYLKFCDIENEEDFENIYNNVNITEEIKKKFNNFLSGCKNRRITVCNCEKILPILPIFISEYTTISDEKEYIPFRNPNEFRNFFPLLNVYPAKDDEDDEKLRKFQFILDLNCIKKNGNASTRELEPDERNYYILPQFWKSQLLYQDDTLFKEKIIDTMTDLIMNPNSNAYRLHRLEHEFILINGKKKNLDQIDIFQKYQLGGVFIYPRLRFRIYNGIIYFNDIIYRH